MRIKRSVNALKKRRKVLRSAKGYWGARSKLYRVAKQAVMKAGQYAYVGITMPMLFLAVQSGFSALPIFLSKSILIFTFSILYHLLYYNFYNFLVF